MRSGLCFDCNGWTNGLREEVSYRDAAYPKIYMGTHDYLWYVDIRDKGVELVDRVLVLIPQPGQPHAHPAASAHDRFQVLCVDLFPHTFSIFRICNYLRI